MKKDEKIDMPPLNIFEGLIRDKLNPIVDKICELLFRNIKFDNESLQTMNEYSGKVNMVYASFHNSNIALLILYKLLKKNQFETPVYAIECNPFMFQSIGYILLRIKKFFLQFLLRKDYPLLYNSDYIEHLIRKRKNIIISLLSEKKFFLRRYMEVKYDSLIHLIDIQKKYESPIYLFPQMIFWNMNPERSKNIIVSKATGDRGFFSGILSTWRSPTPTFVRISAPINLQEEINNANNDDSKELSLVIRNKLLDIYNHEKKSVLGPVIKSKQEMMEKVLYHKNVLDEIERLSREDNIPARKLKKMAYKYYQEIAADFWIVAIKFFEVILNYIFKRMFDGISYDVDSFKMIREASKRGPIIFTPAHKSHMDYLILSYSLFKNRMIPPHIAAGVNLSFFPLGTLFRHSGAFFMRRSFKGLKLYPEIFQQYIKTLLSENYPIEFFIEGGRSRTGKLLSPRVGLLRYLLNAIEEGYNKDLIFVPTTINYDRIIEEDTYSNELKGVNKEKESIGAVVEGRKLLKRKHGKVYLKFHEPFSLNEIKNNIKEDEELLDVVANTIINQLNEITLITPFALVTTATLLLSNRGFSKEIISKKIGSLYNYLNYSRVPMSDTLLSSSNLKGVIDNVIDSYLNDHIIEPLYINDRKKKINIKDFYILNEENRSKIGFYRNSIIVYFLPLSIVSISLLYLNKKGEINEDSLTSEYYYIKDIFSKEFFINDEKKEDGNNSWKTPVDFLLSQSYISKGDKRIHLNNEKIDEILLFSIMLKDYLESYYIVIDTVLDHKNGRINKKEFFLNLRKNSMKKYHLGMIQLSESLSVPNFNNAVKKCIDSEILKEHFVSDKESEFENIDLQKAEDLFKRIMSYIEIISVNKFIT